jgi:hypothetical protein
MGVLTDLVIATEADLGGVSPDELPISVFPGVDIKGIGIIELAILHGLLAGKEFDPRLEAFPMVGGQESEDGPWLNRLPQDFVERLAGLDGEHLSSAAAQWRATEEFEHNGWDPEDISQRLGEVCELAKRAVSEGKPIHLWTCL